MQSIIGSVKKEHAKELFARPECNGEKFREIVDIYACGDGSWLANIVPTYIKKLRSEENAQDYVVVARSFMSDGCGGPHGGRGGHGPHGPGHGEPPIEMFDIVYCAPLEAITDKMVEETTDLFCSGRGGGRRL